MKHVPRKFPSPEEFQGWLHEHKQDEWRRGGGHGIRDAFDDWLAVDECTNQQGWLLPRITMYWEHPGWATNHLEFPRWARNLAVRLNSSSKMITGAGILE